MQQVPNQQPSSSQGTSKVVVVVAVAVGALMALVAVVGVFAALAISGMRKYLMNAKAAEGRAAVTSIARGVIACSHTERVETLNPTSNALPPTTTPVPASIDDISNKKYMSVPWEWTSPGWDCIGFRKQDPQYFQYQWVRTSATEGTVRGVSDLDGDRAPDFTFEVPIMCTAAPVWSCKAGTLVETR